MTLVRNAVGVTFVLLCSCPIVLAALTFGVSLYATGRVGREASVLWVLVPARLALNDSKEVAPVLVELLQESPDYFWCVFEELSQFRLPASK